MKKNYISKDKSKTILLLADDIRTNSGVGNMARQIVLSTAHHFNWVNIGGAVKHPDAGKGFDVSEEITKSNLFRICAISNKFFSLKSIKFGK